MKCPSCGSENCQRLEVVHDAGTQNISTTGHTSGMAVGLVGSHPAIGFGSATTATAGVSQTRLAASAAPPTAKPVRGWFITAFVSFIVFCFLSDWAAWFWLAIPLTLLALCCYMIFAAAKWNSKELPSRQRRWRRAWMCHVCGKEFVP